MISVTYSREPGGNLRDIRHMGAGMLSWHKIELLKGAAMTLGKTGVTYRNDLNLGQVVMSAVISMVGGVVLWGLQHGNTADSTKAEFDLYRRANQAEFAQFRTEIKEQFTDMKAAVGVLPSQAARLDQVEHRVPEVLMRIEALTSKLADTDRAAIEARETAKRLDQQVQRLDGQVNVSRQGR